MIKYKNVKWQFNYALLSSDVKAYVMEHKLTHAELSELLGMKAVAGHMARGDYVRLGNHISMGNLLEWCNLADIAPSRYFDTID